MPDQEPRIRGGGTTFPGTPVTTLPWDRVTVSGVIPAYNEIATVEKLLRRVKEVPLDLEVIVVDDGSTDGTRDLLRELEGELIDQLHFHEKNSGKGAALRTGFGRATGDVIVVQDADLQPRSDCSNGRPGRRR